MIANATINFLAMIALQIYIQLSLSLMRVQSLSQVPLHVVIINRKYLRVSINNVHFCEYAIDLNDDGSRLTVSTFRNEVHMDRTCTLPISCYE